VVNLSPIIYDGAHVSLEGSEDTTNRFEVKLDWLVVLVAVGFLNEHWNEEGVKAAFCKVGTVVEINPTCLDSNSRLFPVDLSSVRVVVERMRPSGMPKDIVVGNVGVRGRASCFVFTVTVLREDAPLWHAEGHRCRQCRASCFVFTVTVLRAWPRVSQLDTLSNLRPFFPCPPSLGNGNGGPHGPPACRGPLPTFGSVLPGAAAGLGPWANGGSGFVILGFDTRLHHPFRLCP
jgi:hypothetical protein